MPIPQLFKIAAGVAQVLTGIWLLALWRADAKPSRAITALLAIAFATNGIAYAIFNTALPGARRADMFAVEGWGAFNWISTAAVMAFAALMLSVFNRWKGSAIALAVLVAGLELSHLMFRGNWLVWGGGVIYVAIACALGVLAVAFGASASADVRMYCGLVSAALIVNSVDHIGAGIIRPRLFSPVELAAMAILVAVWIGHALMTSADRKLALLVILSACAFFVAGVATRLVVGTYQAVQESGFIGVGRFVASGILVALPLKVFRTSLYRIRESPLYSHRG